MPLMHACMRARQENTVAPDYVTEKLYDAFAGGCVPVYYGATNVQDFLPDIEAIVDFRRAHPHCVLADLT